jgi:hypothetical protein
MNTPRITRIAGAALFALTLCASFAMAQTPETSMFELTEPTIVGDVTLQPGQYMISVIPSLSERHRVTVTDVNKTKVYTTVLTVPHALRPNETVPEARLLFFPAAAGETRALRTWFPRNAPREVGHDIVYDEERATMFARASNSDVVTYRGTTEAPEVRVVTPQATFETYEPPTITARTETRVETPVATRTEMPETVTEETDVRGTRTELPRTAGNDGLIALLGIAALAGAAGVRALNR